MRKIIAVLFTIALVFPLLLSAQAVIGAASFVLDRQFYVEALDSEPVYEAVVTGTLIHRFLAISLSLPANTNTAQLEAILRSILNQEYFRTQVSAITDNFFDYLQGREEDFNPSIDISSVKNALAGEKQDEFLLALAQALPACEPTQTPGLGGLGQPACKPAGVPDEILARDYLKPIFPLALAQIPDQVPLVENWQELRKNRNYRSFLPGMAIPASLLFSALFLVFVALSFWYIGALIAEPSWRGRLLWLGWTLIIPSAMLLLSGLTAGSAIPAYWIDTGLSRVNFSGVQFSIPGINETLRAILLGALPRASRALVTVGGVSASLALGLIVWGLAKSKPRPKEPVAE